MTEARPLIEPFLAEGDIEAAAQKISTAYKACDELMRGNLAFSMFPVGIEQRPHILRALVDFALMNMTCQREGFFYEIKWNAAHNCRSLVLSKGRLFITQHFMGLKNFRTAARHAKSRESLAGFSGQLFPVDGQSDLFKDGGYVQFLHGGKKVKPEFISLVIPTEDQTWIRARSAIAVPEPEAIAAEMITEELAMQLKTVAKQEEDGEDGEDDADAKATG